VTVHDLRGTLRSFLSPERFSHKHSLCAALKVNHSPACIEFDITRLRREISGLPDGRVNVCFAGIVEFVVPVFHEHELEWVIFAGPRSVGPRLTSAARDTAPPPGKSPWPRGTPMAKPVNDDEAQAILENLRQLAARLRAWSTEIAKSGFETPLARDEYPDSLARRRTIIRNFIHHHHREAVRLEDLAQVLHLSESRAGHAVKEACGDTFVKLLNEARLRTAAGLLQHTNVSVLEIALRSGFGEVSQFHRNFRERFKSTPLKYRKQAESAQT
jgi:AraC-like DNA-binding protein